MPETARARFAGGLHSQAVSPDQTVGPSENGLKMGAQESEFSGEKSSAAVGTYKLSVLCCVWETTSREGSGRANFRAMRVDRVKNSRRIAGNY